MCVLVRGPAWGFVRALTRFARTIALLTLPGRWRRKRLARARGPQEAVLVCLEPTPAPHRDRPSLVSERAASPLLG